MPRVPTPTPSVLSSGSWQLAGSEQPLDASVNYEFFDNEILVTRHVNNEQVERRLPLDNFSFSPLMRIYSGRVIRELDAGGAMAAY